MILNVKKIFIRTLFKLKSHRPATLLMCKLLGIPLCLQFHTIVLKHDIIVQYKADNVSIRYP